MSLLKLPYEIISHITSFLNILDVVELAITCSYIHSYLKARLEIHQHKISTLSSVHDRDQYRTISLLLNLFSRYTTSEDAWYVREVTINSYHPNIFVQDYQNNYIFRLPDDWQTTREELIANLGQFWSTNLGLDQIAGLLRAHSRIQNASEIFLTLSLLRMPRLAKVRLSLHPSHGHYDMHARFHSNDVDDFRGPYIPPSELFVRVLSQISWLNMREQDSGPGISWPPGLQSVRSIELDVEELHSFYRSGLHRSRSPRVYDGNLTPLLHLPNLRRLLINNNNSVPPVEVSRRYYGTRDFDEWSYLRGESSIEELILIGFGGWQEYVRLMIRSIRRLRVFVLHRRGDEEEARGTIETLRLEHGFWLETLVLPTHISNALSWCQAFLQLKELTISYVDVMAAFRRQQSLLSTPEGHGSRSEPFGLADSLPEGIEVLTLIGGRQSSTVMSVRAIPLYTDIQDFLNIMILLISTKGSGSAYRRFHERPRHLRDICFGDMRIAVAPEDEAVGKTLHQSYTKAREIARLKLNNEIEKSTKLKEACAQFGVRLHITDLKRRVCDHLNRHAYIANRRSSRQELCEEADRLSQDADHIVQNTLAQYVDTIPRKYRP